MYNTDQRKQCRTRVYQQGAMENLFPSVLFWKLWGDNKNICICFSYFNWFSFIFEFKINIWEIKIKMGPVAMAFHTFATSVEAEERFEIMARSELAGKSP